MAVCNAQRFLAEAIQSILDQSFADFEFIIVDYGSRDGSRAIIRDYAGKDSRIEYCEIPECVLPEARNAGCFRARGRYIAVMDADDVSLPDRLTMEVAFMDSHPQVALLGGAVEWIDSAGLPFHVHRHPVRNSEIQQELLTHSVFWHPTTIMRKEAFDSVGGYRPVFVCAHDYDLAVRIAEKSECANLDQAVLKYRFHASQLSTDKQQKQALCKLAARASAAERRRGQTDPLDGILEITPSTLATLGVGELAQRNALVADARSWIRNMIDAGEYAAAFTVARGVLQSNLDRVDHRQVSELHLAVASICWRRKNFFKWMIALGQAVRAHPLLLGRPLKPLFQKLGMA